MCVDEVEGEVVVNLLQGEITMRMDGGISDYQIGTYISMGMWRYSVINNNRAITGCYLRTWCSRQLCIIIVAIWIASTYPNWEGQQLALLLVHPGFNMSFPETALNCSSPFVL